MNMIAIMGRLVRDPGYSEIQSEKGKYHVATFYLAVPRNYAKEVNYIKVTAFGKQADFTRDYLKQGKRVVVTGELMTGSYKDKETGKTMRTAEVTANRIEFADGKDSPAAPVPAPYEDGFMDIPDGLEGELPFR